MRIIALLFFFTFSLASYGQEDKVTPDVSSPYHSLLTHLYFLQQEHYAPEKAALCISDDLDSLDRIQAAIRIKKIYDGKGLYVYLSKVPSDTMYRDSVSQRAVYTPFPKELPSVYLERRKGKWIYSSETMNRLERTFKSAFPFGTHVLVDKMGISDGKEFLGLFGWQYLGLLVLIVLAITLYFILQWLIPGYALRFLKRWLNLSDFGKKKLVRATKYLSLYLSLMIFKLSLPILQLPIEFTRPLMLVVKVINLVLWIIILTRIVDLVREYLEDYTETTDNRLDDQFVPLLANVVKIIIGVIGVMAILKSLNVNITALIAGVSIGGLALALAAQDTVKNLIGSLMIFLDRPFQVDDYITSPGIEGTVVEVGFRTTRIRKVDTSVIAVPNGQLINAAVTNYGVRSARMYQMTTEVQYDTPVSKIEQFIQKMELYLTEHDRVDSENFLVRFTQMKDSSLSILLRAYIHAESYAEELQQREAINIKILSVAEELGIGLAFPTQTIELKNKKEDAQ